jgi:hypothetical protein
MGDFFRRFLLVIVFVLTIGMLFVSGNKEKLEKVIEEKDIKGFSLMSNN